jgi:class 3 adenylate cyclase
VQAGVRSVSMAAYEEALEHYDRALQALDLKQPDEPVRRCELLLQLAEVHEALGTVDQGKEVALRAAELAHSLDNTEMLARAGLYMGAGLDVAPDETRVEILNEALAALGEGDSALSVRLLSQLAMEFFSSEPVRAESFAERSLAMARRVGDPEALASALYAKHTALLGAERLEERQAIATELMQVASQSGLTDFLSIGLASRFGDLLEQGDAEGAKPALDAYVALHKEAREPHGIWHATVYRGLWALLEGRFAEAERLAEAARAHARRFEHLGGEISYAVQIGRVRVEQGRLEELLPIYEAANARTPHHGWRSRIAWLCAELGREEQSRHEFEQLAVEDFGTIQHDFGWLLTVGYAAEACAFLGDTRRAEILYQMLLPHAWRNIVVVNAACNGSVSRQLGMLTATLGRLEDAERHFDDALALNRRMGSPPFTARVQCDYARMLLARDAPGDRERALQLTAESLATARELGMKLVAERALASKLEAQGVAASDTAQSIYAVASRVHDDPPDLRSHAAPDGTVTLMFSDMEGFTRMTERLGDVKARDVVRDHNRIVRQQTSAHRGYEVELQGDGFLLAFGSARTALQCAIDVQRDFARYNAAHPDEPIRVRIGLHTGEVLRDADKFFGRTVILAARIAARASGGEILMSSVVRQLSESLGDLRFGAPREEELKGIAEPQRLHPVLWD